MLVFIDESGDAGLKVDGGSSRYFIVTLVAFEDHQEAQAADDRIDLLRREIGVSDRFEFHFNKMKPNQRKQFLSAIGRHGRGATARSYSGKADAQEYRKLIAHREIYVQFWPK